MDFFDCQYYSLPRKLLLLIGLWPYQEGIGKTAKQISMICIVLSVISTQVAKILSSGLDKNLIVEVTAVQIAALICVIKSYTFSIQAKKIKLLLDTIESDWNSLNNADDRKIAEDCAEAGRNYNSFVVVILYSVVMLIVICFALQPLFNIIIPRNDTYIKILLYPAEYYIDSDKYFYPILLHMSISALVGITTIAATDTLYIACVYHACGMFKIVSYRLEHIFDKYKQDEPDRHGMNSKICIKIARAVNYHYNTIKYIDTIISTFEVQLFITVILVFCNISITMYCTVMSLEKLSKMLGYMLLATCQMIQVLIVVYPCQLMADNSTAISFKAYCAKWYTAPFKLQTLLLPIIQRGSKPSNISVAKIITATFENYAAAIQLSLSYFTVLLSFS